MAVGASGMNIHLRASPELGAFKYICMDLHPTAVLAGQAGRKAEGRGGCHFRINPLVPRVQK